MPDADTFPTGRGEAPPATAPVLGVPEAARRAIPHLAAFFPDHHLLPAAEVPDGARLLALAGEGAARPPRGRYLVAAEGPWRAPAFGDRRLPLGLVVAAAPEADADPVALILGAGLAARGLDGAARQAAADVQAALRTGRIGGAPGLPDPGPAGLGLRPGAALVVVDPGSRNAGAEAMLRTVLATADGRLVLLAASPDTPPGPPALPDLPGTRRLPGRLAPWTLLDLAAELHVLDGPLGLLAHLVGAPVRAHAPVPWAGSDPLAALAALLTATRWADPFLGLPWPAAQGLRQLAAWRDAEAANRGIAATTGIEWWKRRRVRASLAHAAGTPPTYARGSAALRAARRAGGGVAVWSSVTPPNLRARAAAAGVPLFEVEDGFIRSAGLGVLLAPAASLVVDGRGMHYDPVTESDLEHLLATADFPPALLARAAALRAALLAGGVTKYNLAGAMPETLAPPGRRVVLVPGQVEDDAAMRRGGAGVRTNLGLLRAARAAEPDAHLLYKPHPDVEAGMRTGAVPAAALAGLADGVLSGVPIGPLYARVDALHVMSSLAGFEALLRGLPVHVHGRPFYAGWGLTTDHDPPPRRGRALSLDMLVAGALILYPRYLDPVTGLPCPPEVLLTRLATPVAPRSAPRTPAPLRALIGAVSRRLATWFAAR